MSFNTKDASPTGENLRERRRVAGISQQRLAELARCSIASVQLHEKGYSPPGGTARARMVAALDTLVPR